MLARIAITIFLITPFFASAELFVPVPMPKPDNSAFYEWRDNFRPYALQQGIDKDVFDEGLANVKPDASIIKLDRKQYKSTITLEQYLNRVISSSRIKTARKLYKQNKPILEMIQKESGVEPEFIVALWGLESNFGQNTGGFHVIESLATLAYEGRRRDFFEGELINALKIIQEGHILQEDMNGSWAGAMGQSQFMPTSFYKYAVDYNGDGRKDIWGTKNDVFASIANYLKTEGWSNKKEDKEKTLMHWNRSSFFVASVFKLSEEIKK